MKTANPGKRKMMKMSMKENIHASASGINPGFRENLH